MTRNQENRTLERRRWLQAVCFGAALGGVEAWAQTPGNEPVFRVAKKIGEGGAPHPLDPALKLASDGLVFSRKNIRDYTCKLVKRERVNGVVGNTETISAKIRNRKVENERIVTPFSVYLKFEKPSSVKDREVLYVEGANSGKMLAKEGGFQGKFLPSVWLKPDGPLAMRGQLYPLTEIGIENLMVKLIERGTREKKRSDCEVKFHKGFKINGRVCTLLELKHPNRRPEHEFYVARIFIDDEYGIPIRYAAYDWPKKVGGNPEVIEEYTYLNLKLNVGLSDSDFSHSNSAYNF